MTATNGGTVIDHDALTATFAEYVTSIAAGYAVEDVLYRLADRAVTVLEVDGARVCVGDGDEALRCVAVAGERMHAVAQPEEETCLGTCLRAHRSGRPVAIADLSVLGVPSDGEPRGFPGGAAVGLPLRLSDRSVGALHLHRERPRSWSDRELATARLLADMAAGYIVNARDREDSKRLADQLRHALDSRVVIEQAKGILAERHRITPAAAFDRLRDHARSGNHGLRQVAAGIVDGALEV